ncbi:hypothetical protein [Rugosimonospora africana]|nr:hypothetical protein [Rugosimonospora africana]
MPNETSSITIALVLLMWALGVLALLGTVVWSRAHPGRLAQWARRHSVRAPQRMAAQPVASQRMAPQRMAPQRAASPGTSVRRTW